MRCLIFIERRGRDKPRQEGADKDSFVCVRNVESERRVREQGVDPGLYVIESVRSDWNCCEVNSQDSLKWRSSMDNNRPIFDGQ